MFKKVHRGGSDISAVVILGGSSGNRLREFDANLFSPIIVNFAFACHQSAMDPKTYPEWQANLLKLLVSTTRAASAVGSHDISFERSIDSNFDSSLTEVTDRLLSITNRLLKFAGSQQDEFEDEDDLDDRWGDVVDIVDSLLERAVWRFMPVC